MRTLLFLLGVLCTISCLSQTNVPSSVQSSFAKLFPGATVKKWDKEDGKYEANFTKEGTQRSAVFDANGNLEETETAISVDKLPAPVIPYVKEHYKGIKIEAAAMVLKSNGEKVYEAEINGKDLTFDTKGNFLKEEMEKD